MVMPSLPKRAVTVAPLPSLMYLKFKSRTRAAASTLAQALAGEFHAAHGDEADGEAVHAVADVGACAVGSEDVAGEVVVARARATSNR